MNVQEMYDELSPYQRQAVVNIAKLTKRRQDGTFNEDELPNQVQTWGILQRIGFLKEVGRVRAKYKMARVFAMSKSKSAQALVTRCSEGRKTSGAIPMRANAKAKNITRTRSTKTKKKVAKKKKVTKKKRIAKKATRKRK